MANWKKQVEIGIIRGLIYSPFSSFPIIFAHHYCSYSELNYINAICTVIYNSEVIWTGIIDSGSEGVTYPKLVQQVFGSFYQYRRRGLLQNYIITFVTICYINTASVILILSLFYFDINIRPLFSSCYFSESIRELKTVHQINCMGIFNIQQLKLN